MRAAELLRLLLGLCAGLTQLRRGHGARHAVYWNSSNPKFLREEYALQVDLNDYLEVLCPHYEARVPLEDTESFVLYMVEKDKYRGCYDTIGASKRWECNRPHAPYGPIKFLEKIQKFTPFSLGFEFQAGKEYYYFLKASPSKKSRTMPGLTRRATQANVPTQLLLSDDSKQYLTPDSEPDQGALYGRPDVLPRTPPVDEAASDSLATTLSTSSLGSGGLNSPAHRSVGVEVHKAEATEHEMPESGKASPVLPGEEEEEEAGALDPDQIETEICF